VLRQRAAGLHATGVWIGRRPDMLSGMNVRSSLACETDVDSRGASRRRLRVLFVNDHLGYAGGVVHGVTRYFLNVIPRLSAHVEAEACFLRGPHPAAQRLREAGIDVSFLGRRKHDPRVLGDLVSLVRRRRIDILHLAGMKSILLGRLAARRARCRTVIHLHDTQRLGPVLGFLQRRLAHWTDAAIGVSDAVSSLAIAEFGMDPRLTTTIHNGIPIEEFASPPVGARQSIRREFRIDANAPVVGMLGRLASEKQPMLLVSALPRLLTVHPRAILFIVGDGALRIECQDAVVRLGIGSSVRFAGQRTDVAAVLAAMDVVAVPSSREGFGYAVVEAFAAGKPVVAFRVDGLTETIVEGETGLLVDPDNAAGLVDAVSQVLNNPSLAARLGERARSRAQAYSIDTHVRRLEALYRHVLIGNEAPAVASR
jgi:glycosyltransferase involved in cell wall biosynthesis